MDFGWRADGSYGSRAEDEFRFLVEVNARLSQSLDYRTTLQAVAMLAVPTLADWCAVDMLTEDGRLESVAVAHVDPEKVRWIRSLGNRFNNNMDADHGMPNVVRTGRSELYQDIIADLIEPRELGDDEVDVACAAGFHAVVLVPLTVRGEHIGGLAIVSSTPGKYTERDVEFFRLFAERAAVAIDNSKLYTLAQQEIAARAKAEADLREHQELLESRVRERTAELEDAFRQLETFSYSVSHDLRSPLRSINGAIGNLLSDYGEQLGADALKELNRAYSSSKRMAMLIDDLLEYARVGTAAIEKERIDLSDLAAGIVADLSGTTDVSFSIEPGLVIFADPGLVRVVLQNLIENAVKFCSKSATPSVVVGCSASGAFFVRDNGVGFEPKFAERIFEPFERLHGMAEFPGTGIGLASVRRVVERHGGRVWAESVPGQGAIFFFRFEA